MPTGAECIPIAWPWCRYAGLLPIALLGCGADTGDSPGEAIDRSLDPCGFNEPVVATIDISERADIFHAGVFSRVEAKLQDVPSPSFHEVVLEEGECRYLKQAIDTHYSRAVCPGNR